MGHFDPQETINGTYGTLLIDGMEMYEFAGMNVNLEIETAEVFQPCDAFTGYKQVGVAGDGEFNLTRINHTYTKKWAKMVMEGKHPKPVLLCKVDDPDSKGKLVAIIKDVTLLNVPILEVEPKTIMKDTYKFKFARLEFPE